MNQHVDFERVCAAHKTVLAELSAERTRAGQAARTKHRQSLPDAESWVGQLSSSPPATAAAVSALVLAHGSNAGQALRDISTGNSQFHSENILQDDLSELIVESLHWLARHQNEDGGWGDATGACSNLAATMLVCAAFRLTGVPAKYERLTERAEQYIAVQDGAAGLRRQCRDRLWAAPVLANGALAGLVPWRQVPALPFELACLPRRLTARLRLPARGRWTDVGVARLPLVVSLGLLKFHHDPPRNPLVRAIRRAARARSLAALERMQVSDGGFLDSTPWTAAVVMSLASVGDQHHPIVTRGLEFLLGSVRSDASWPICTNLATSNTTLAINSLADEPTRLSVVRRPLSVVKTAASNNRSRTADHGRNPRSAISSNFAPPDEPNGDSELFDERCLDWLLRFQHTEPDPLTGVPPGGWGWGDQPGAIPNSDDTAGALLALARWRRCHGESPGKRVERAALQGARWLLDAQRPDGGWPAAVGGPTPLGRVACDLTAQALRALVAWRSAFVPSNTAYDTNLPARQLVALAERIPKVVERGWEFLQAEQRDDGSFTALRFGNEHHPDGQNPVYGTSCVLLACAELDRLETELAQRAARWLLAAQHAGGGWGPPRTPLDYSGTYRKNGSQSWRANRTLEKFCSVEETALAVQALLPLMDSSDAFARAVHQGLNWLVDAVEQDRHRQPAVIGIHATRLWYHERLYPLLFAAGALERAVRQLAPLRPTVASVG